MLPRPRCVCMALCACTCGLVCVACESVLLTLMSACHVSERSLNASRCNCSSFSIMDSKRSSDSWGGGGAPPWELDLLVFDAAYEDTHTHTHTHEHTGPSHLSACARAHSCKPNSLCALACKPVRSAICSPYVCTSLCVCVCALVCACVSLKVVLPSRTQLPGNARVCVFVYVCMGLPWLLS